MPYIRHTGCTWNGNPRISGERSVGLSLAYPPVSRDFARVNGALGVFGAVAEAPTGKLAAAGAGAAVETVRLGALLAGQLAGVAPIGGPLAGILGMQRAT